MRKLLFISLILSSCAAKSPLSFDKNPLILSPPQIPSLSLSYETCRDIGSQNRMNEELISDLFMQLNAIKNSIQACQDGLLDGIQIPELEEGE